MAISPTVNGYMQQDAQPQQNADQLFIKQFTDQAYNTFRAKYPGLMPLVVTLKVLASDVDAATAFAVFSVRKGRDLAYIPVVMANGIIVSCEMVYDKGEDLFSALTEAVVKNLQDENRYTDPVMLNNNPRVEDTRALFHNMLRPPQSSNVLLASFREGVSALPNECKELVRNYLQNENPQALGKIAGFYDVRYLAQQLKNSPQVKTAQDEGLPEFLRLETLTRKMAEQLEDEEKAAIMENGWLVKSAIEGDILHVGPEENLIKNIESFLRLETFPAMGETKDSPLALKLHRLDSCDDLREKVNGEPVKKAFVVKATSSGINLIPAVLFASGAYTPEGAVSFEDNESILVSQPEDLNLPGWFKKFPGIAPIDKIKDICENDAFHYCSFIFFVPSRGSGWLAINSSRFFGGKKEDLQVSEATNTESPFKFSNKILNFKDQKYSSVIMVSDDIKAGFLVIGNTVILPKNTLVCQYNQKVLNCVRSFDELRKLINIFGTKLVNQDNGAGISITDMREEKTASFQTNVDAAEWLHRKYAMTTEQIKSVLSNKRTLMLTKTAFGEPGVPVPQGNMEMPADPASGYFNGANINDVAEIGDPELLDPGILSSFANYPDIKALLVDYLPDFMTAADRLGRIVLMFSYQKKDIEEYFGAEKYSSLMNSCRKIFTVISDLVINLKSYVNMM